MNSKGYFSRHAEKWDEMTESYFGEELREEVIEKSGVEGGIFVDIGCGTGFMTLGLAKIAKRVYGIDSFKEMLKVAKENLKGFGNVEFRLGDIEKIPLKDLSVDAVFGNMVLHHAPNPKIAISECSRVLREGGKLVISDLDEHENEWVKEEMADLWLGFERRDVRKLFEDAGLKNIIVDCVGSCCSESFNGERVEMSIFVAIGEKLQ
ncbi:MAG: class I SAM-dependent methyltransferase [Candidatus Methanofastidiosia archaeon]